MDKRLLRFFLAVFATSWLFWAAAVLLEIKGWIAPAVQVLTCIGNATPSVLGLVFAWRDGGKKGLNALVKASGTRRYKGRQWLAIAVPFAALLLSAAIQLLFGQSLPPLVMPLVLLFSLPFQFLIGGPLFEELGWRGYALPRLLHRHRPLTASLLLGVVWAIWAIPMAFWGDLVLPALLPYGIATCLCVYLLYAIFASILATIVYLRAENSIMLAMLLHTACLSMISTALLFLEKIAFLICMLCFIALSCILTYTERRLLLERLPAKRMPPEELQLDEAQMEPRPPESET